MEQNQQTPSTLPQPPPPPPPPPPPVESDNHEPALKKTKMSSSDTETSSRPRRYKRRKVAIFLAFCGVGYQGMQKNPGAKTIEGDLEEALYLAGAVPDDERGQPNRYDWGRSSRTDKGVSAVGQVISGKFFVDPPGFVQRLNSFLSPQIRIFGYKRVTPTFNAKKFCDRRRYVYLLPVFALDSSCHRDRESVLESLGSADELVKCFECSERGRKVFGVLGNKRGDAILCKDFDASMLLLKDEGFNVSVVCGNNVDGEQLMNDVGILSHNGAAFMSSVQNVKTVGEELKNDVAALTSQVLVQSDVVLNNEEGVSSLNAQVEGKQECPCISVNDNSNGTGESTKARVSEFKYGDEVKERFNRLLKYYEGTHNFHNYTTRTKAEDPSAKRYIVSFQANTTLTIDGIEFVKCEVVGQSFMLHQIRKMMGMAVAVMRDFASESIYETSFNQNVRINVPTAPEVGLYLDECFFTSYNNKWHGTHEEVSMKTYAEEAEEFKLKHIYSHIADMEHKEGAVALWLHSLNRRNYPDLCHSEPQEVLEGAADPSA